MSANEWVFVAVFGLALGAAIFSARSMRHVQDPESRLRVALLGLFASRSYFDAEGRRLLRRARGCAAAAFVVLTVWALV